MGPYLFALAALVGFFAFGAIYHFILWSRVREQWALFAFAVLCVSSSANAFAVLGIATAATIAQGQAWGDARVVTASLGLVAVVWMFALISGMRTRGYQWLATAVVVAVVARSLFVGSVLGAVTGVERILTSWGETISVLQREQNTLWVLPTYAVALSVPVFGTICARRLRPRDRVGAALVFLAAFGYLGTVVVALSVDLFGTSLPYVGPIVTAGWILPMAWQVARSHGQQGDDLVAAERRFRAIFDQTFQFIGLLRVDGTLLEANQTALAFAGVRSQDVIGRKFWDTAWWSHSPDLQDRLRAAVEAAGRGQVVRFEATHPGADGELHFVDFSLKPTRDASGAVVLLIPEGRDITERVRAEEAKRGFEQRMLQSQKMEALGQLAGGIAHDFNNLLTVIAGHADMLLIDAGADRARRHDSEQIRLAAERAASMTRQLLAFSRRSLLEPKVVNLNTVVADVETMLRRTIGEHIELTVRSVPDLHPVTIDPDQFGRVLLNMAINARDAMPQGGTLVIETRNVVTGGFDDAGPRGPSGDYVLVVMADTGRGMTPEVKARLFEPFYTTKEPGKGTGLGLAVADGIVQQSGGWIDVESEPGAGTTFQIYLPAMVGGAIAWDATSEHRAVGGTETVLLVEDEDAVREMVQASLERLGHTVFPARSGAEALQIARARRGDIDLVLTDVVMPGMSGPQMVEQLRLEHPDLAVVFMSGYMADAALRHGIEVGEADFLQKPFSTSALVAKLRHALDRGRPIHPAT